MSPALLRAPAARALAVLVLAAGIGALSSRACAADGADSLSARECVALARRLAPSLRAAQFDRLAAEADSAAAAVNGRPGLALNAGTLIAPKGFYDPAVTNLGDYELKLAMGWTLADGGRLARERRRAALELAAARWRAALEARDAGLRAAELAFQLLRFQHGEESRVRSIEWIGRLQLLVRAGVRAGTRGSADSIRVALERDAAIADLETARIDARLAAMELLALIGRDPGGSVAIREAAEGWDRAPAEADSARLMASVPIQPEIAIARTAEAQGRLDLLDARRRNAATVEMTLDGGLAGTNTTQLVPDDLRAENPDATLSDRLRRDLGASAAVRLHLPLRDPGVGSARRAREAALGAARVRSEAEGLAQRRRALGLLAKWQSAYRRLAAAQVTNERAATNLLKLQSLYSAGATTLLDLLDARRVQDDARERLADAAQQDRFAQFQVEDRP